MRPSILLVLFDDLRTMNSSALPLHMPRLATVAREGTTYALAVANYPVCAPSRTMLLTGRFLPHWYEALVDADGRPGALIAGSTMVQCVLGTVWTGDEHRGARRSYQTEPSSEYYRVYEQTLANGRTLTLYYKDKID